ncbi:MAG: hypothetical protein KGD74_10765 [Candidatus Lokiarchaeota archaeon]|nr:hypothetical protein [Candidatus Lokiarchaeota archaeon]
MKSRQFASLGFIGILILSSLVFPLINILTPKITINQPYHNNFIHTSAETIYNQEWLINNDFSTQDAWYYTKGAQGDNSTVDANISSGQANYIILGDSNTIEISGVPNNTWAATPNLDWGVFPDNHGFDDNGCWVNYTWDESDGDETGQTPSIQWKKQINLPFDMTNFRITSASIETKFNASVQATPYGSGGIDVPGDTCSYLDIGDWARFYVLIEDLENEYQPFELARNRTRNLGSDGPPAITNITNTPLDSIDEELLIEYLELVLGINSTSFNFTLGIDLYCEDNDSGYELDIWEELRFNSYNLTFTYEREIKEYSSISWNQKGNKITGGNVQITDANLKFNYKIDQDWPTPLSTFSEIRILINNNPHTETIRLSSANTTWQDAKLGGFDVTNLILKDINITLSLQVFIANTFTLNNNITISIVDVYLNITYIETFPDYGTESQLFLETINKTANRFIKIPLGNTVNITIKYLDNQTGNHISGANVQLSGKVSGQLNENDSLEQYSRIINSTYLGIGIWSLTVTAQKSNYETQIIQFYVEVFERATEFELYVNDTQKSNNDIIQIEANKILNLTAFYRDNITKVHLSGAEATLLGVGNFSEIGPQYNYTLNSNDLSIGFNVLSIFTQLDNYESQNIQIYIEVYDIASELQLLVDDTPTNALETIQLEVNQHINLTIFYRDNVTEQHISGATVTLDWDNFTETGFQYNYSLNTNDLDQGITIVTIEAQFTNYQSKSIQFFIEVVERATQLQLFINGEDKIADPVYELPFGSSLNITVIYSDNQTETHISGGNIQLINDTYSSNFTENLAMNQYTLLLDTTVLKIGVNLFTINAHANNFQVKTLSLRITLNKIATVINTTSGESYFSILPSESISLAIVLTDIDFGGPILNATVTYRWAYGQGTLLDPENDGTYEDELKDIPTGTYTITITASKGDDYSFKTYEITLNVVSITPPDFSMLFIMLAGALVALVVGFTLYQVRFKYPPIVRKSRKIRKKIRKGKKTKPLKDVASREGLIKDHIESNFETIRLEKKTENGIKEK